MILRKLVNLFKGMVTLPIKFAEYKRLLKKKGEEGYQAEERFKTWAFGEAWDKFLAREVHGMDLAHAWNMRHGNHFVVKGTDLVIDALVKMRKVYEKEMYGMHTATPTTSSEVTSVSNDAK